MTRFSDSVPLMRGLTIDMARGELRPCGLWDEDVSIAELHQIPDGVELPAGVSPAELRAYVAALSARLLALAAPR